MKEQHNLILTVRQQELITVLKDGVYPLKCKSMEALEQQYVLKINVNLLTHHRILH